MSYTTIDDVKLFLNKESLTPAETALAERLLSLVEGEIEGYIGYPAFSDPTTKNIGALEYVVLHLVTKLFNRITHETIGIKSGTFQNVAVSYDIQDLLTPGLRTILDPFCTTSLCG